MIVKYISIILSIYCYPTDLRISFLFRLLLSAKNVNRVENGIEFHQSIHTSGHPRFLMDEIILSQAPTEDEKENIFEPKSKWNVINVSR